MRGTRQSFLGSFLGLLLPGLLLAAGGLFDPAYAQQPEKRIALVVGNGAYAKSPLATTANDAGLIAQTLQAAGFDVVGARDLDGDTLRKSFRDFLQKAQISGPGTVAMIYLAGYGVQLAGENYFIPVDSNITRDTDVPTEALRVSDYVRQLAALPLKADIVVLDAARAQPFIEGGQPIASGLALVEPDANMLIAYNAAPGTVAPEEPGPYGIYAQSLAEMIRTGGLSLPEVFDRVRLRVNDASKGAQVPWDDQKISAQFSFFERGPDAPPPQAAPDQVAAIHNKPIRDLGVQDAYAAALERDTLPAYEEFLTAYPGDPMAKRVMAIVAARREAITWRRTYRADTPDAYWSYLRRYPRGPHAGDARRRLAILTAPLEPPPSFAMMDYDVPPPPPEEIVYVDRPVLLFSDPVFGFVPPPPPPIYYLPPPPPDFIVLPPPLPVVGLFVLPQPVFVPIPVFVRPPIYVAPPPNNIIYQNIHNTTVINNVINRPPMTAAGLAPDSIAPAE
ncbi:caspase family protein, partial [Bradyrhizobium iriomotense]|uniref:caspase family protein n=1 Tax=Bradyrhizobium iriomotense TaxID=441950 RepID=UPI0024E18281